MSWWADVKKRWRESAPEQRFHTVPGESWPDPETIFPGGLAGLNRRGGTFDEDRLPSGGPRISSDGRIRFFEQD